MMIKRCLRSRVVAPWIPLLVLFSAALGAEEAKLDPGRAKSEPGSATLWYDIRDLGVEGQGWEETKAASTDSPRRPKRSCGSRSGT